MENTKIWTNAARDPYAKHALDPIWAKLGLRCARKPNQKKKEESLSTEELQEQIARWERRYLSLENTFYKLRRVRSNQHKLLKQWLSQYEGRKDCLLYHETKEMVDLTDEGLDVV